MGETDRVKIHDTVPDAQRVSDDVTYMDRSEVDRLLDKHMARWSTLLERLK